MVQSEQENPSTPRPTSPSIPAQSTPEPIDDQIESEIGDDESDAVFIATAEPSSDESTESIESTSEESTGPELGPEPKLSSATVMTRTAEPTGLGRRRALI